MEINPTDKLEDNQFYKSFLTERPFPEPNNKDKQFNFFKNEYEFQFINYLKGKNQS